jgi:glycosyltransferase involved in cell wall biosynthesis
MSNAFDIYERRLDCRIERHSRPCDALVSIVVPVFNEEEAIGIFLGAVRDIMSSTGFRFEIVFVNDGSSDRTLERLAKAAKGDGSIRVVNLSRNFG